MMQAGLIHGGVFDGYLARAVVLIGALAASVFWLVVMAWRMGPPKPEREE